jgi:integrase/recombinase XerD
MGRPSSIVVVNENYQKLAQSFYQYQKRLGYVPNSYKARFNYLNEFLHWLECKGNTDITSVAAPEISQYYNYISSRPSKKDGGALSQKTTHSHMRILRDLFEMLLQDGQIKINPTATLKFYYPQSSEERNTITQQEVQQLYEVCNTAQERAILSLAYGCGLRAAELQNCNIEDIKLREKILIVPKGKGNKRRIIPMSNGVVKDLSNYYYNEREALTQGRDYKLTTSNQNAFMLHSRGGRMMDDTYNKYLKALIERTENEALKEKQITIHNLRHSIATHLLEQGIPVEQVRIFLGHSQLETTQIYTHINQKQLENLMQ